MAQANQPQISIDSKKFGIKSGYEYSVYQLGGSIVISDNDGNKQAFTPEEIRRLIS